MRINKKPKYRFADPSLPVAILGMSPGALLGDFEALGFLFESMRVRDPLVYSQAMGAKPFSYRGRDGLEVDAVVEGLGSYAYTRPDGVHVIPIRTLTA